MERGIKSYSNESTRVDIVSCTQIEIFQKERVCDIFILFQKTYDLLFSFIRSKHMVKGRTLLTEFVDMCVKVGTTNFRGFMSYNYIIDCCSPQVSRADIKKHVAQLKNKNTENVEKAATFHSSPFFWNRRCQKECCWCFVEFISQ